MNFEFMEIVCYLPVLIVLLTAFLLLGIEFLSPPFLARYGTPFRVAVGSVGALAAILSLRLFVTTWDVAQEGLLLFNDMVIMDPLSVAAILILALSAILAVMITASFFDKLHARSGEYYLLLFFALFGMMMVATSIHLISMLVGLEILSIALYLLSGYFSSNSSSLEAGLKYLVLGAFSSGLLIYGLAFIFGATGSLSMPAIQEAIAGGTLREIYLRVGLGLLLTGLAFKVAAVPFHMWTPDVYQGAPTPTTAFMSVAVKVAVMVFLLRLLGGTFLGLVGSWFNVVWILVVLSIFAGNILAIQQRSLKRLLAYSSISHAGYILLGFLALEKSMESAMAGVVLYLLVYALMNLGAFATLIAVVAEGSDDPQLDSIRGLGRRRPFLGFCMALFFLALAGLPPTAGFIAKYMVFYAAIQAGLTTTVVLAVIGAMIGIFYYLRVVIYLYMIEPEGECPVTTFRGGAFSNLYLVPVVICGLLILIAGIYPEPFLVFARYSFPSLF